MNRALSVHKTIEVNASRQHAFDVFTRQIATWWPLDYHIGELDAVEVVIEPLTGGRWYERAADGSTCDWGRVLLWEPPTRVVLMWQISADWKADSTIESEIDVRFFDEGDVTHSCRPRAPPTGKLWLERTADARRLRLRERMDRSAPVLRGGGGRF